MKKINLATPFI